MFTKLLSICLFLPLTLSSSCGPDQTYIEAHGECRCNDYQQSIDQSQACVRCLADQTYLPILDQCRCNDRSKFLQNGVCQNQKQVTFDSTIFIPMTFSLNRLFTIQGWFKAKVGSTLFNKLNQINIMISQENGSLQLYVNFSQLEATRQIFPISINLGEWFHFRFVYYAADLTFRAYINEVQVGTAGNINILEDNNPVLIRMNTKSAKEFAVIRGENIPIQDNGINPYKINQYQLQDRLVVYYPFDETSGSRVHDRKRNLNIDCQGCIFEDSTFSFANGGIQLQSLVDVGAETFTNAHQFMIHPLKNEGGSALYYQHKEEIAFPADVGAMTIHFYIKFNTLQPQKCDIFHIPRLFAFSFTFQIPNSGKFYMISQTQAQSGVDEQQSKTLQGVDDDIWYSVTLQVTDTVDLYIDNTLLAENMELGTSFAFTETYDDIYFFSSFDNKNDPSKHCRASMTQFKIYSGIKAVSDLYLKQTQVNDPGLVSYLPLQGLDKDSDELNLVTNYQNKVPVGQSLSYYGEDTTNQLALCSQYRNFQKLNSKYDCTSCIVGCDSCENANSCKVGGCSPGFLLVGEVCEPCPEGCEICSDTSTCDTCYDFFTKEDDLCYCNPPNLVAHRFVNDYTQLKIEFGGPIFKGAYTHPDFALITETANTLTMDLIQGFSVRPGDMFTIPFRNLRTELCRINKEIVFEIGSDDQDLNPFAEINIVPGDTITVDATSSTSGYAIQPLSTYDFAIKSSQSDTFLDKTSQNGPIYSIDRNDLQPDQQYVISLIVENFLAKTFRTQVFYEFACSDVDFSILSAKFIGDYSQIEVILNKEFTYNEALFTAAGYTAIAKDTLTLTLSLQENFTFKPDTLWTLPPNSISVQNCVFETTNQVTLQPDDIAQRPPVLSFTYSDSDSVYTIDGSGSTTGYDSNNINTYNIQVKLKGTDTYFLNITQQEAVYQISKLELEQSETYVIDITVTNFLGLPSVETVEYVYVCYFPQVVSQSYTSDFSAIEVVFEKSVTIVKDILLESNQAQIIGHKSVGSKITLLLKDEFTLFKSDRLLVESISNNFCINSVPIDLSIEYPVELDPVPVLEFYQTQTTLTLVLDKSTSGYPKKKALAVAYSMSSNTGNDLTDNSASLQNFDILLADLSDQEYTVSITLTNFRDQSITVSQTFINSCHVQITSAQFNSEFNAIILQLDRDFALNNQQDIQDVSDIAINGTSMSLELQDNFDYREGSYVNIPGGFFLNSIDVCVVEKALSYQISDNGAVKKQAIVQHTFLQGNNNNYQVTVDTTGSSSGYENNDELAYAYAVYYNGEQLDLPSPNSGTYSLDLSDQPLGLYEIHIILTNFLRESEPVVIEYPYHCKLETVQKVTGFEVEGTWSRKAEIELSFEKLEVDPAFSAAYQWSLVSAPEDSFPVDLSQSRRESTVIQPYSIQGDTTYTLARSLTYVQDSVTKCYVSSELQFKTETELMFCDISGGDSQYSNEQEIVLDASFSKDTNFYFNGQNSGSLRYIWRIDKVDQSNNNPKLTIQGTDYSENTSLEVKLTVISSNQSCVRTSTVTIVTTYTPSAHIVALLTKDQDTFVSNHPVIFKAEVYSKFPDTVTYSWVVPDYESYNTDTRYLKIPAGVIQTGPFTVQLAVTDSAGVEHVQEKTYLMTAPPSGGSFSISPLQGESTTTEFTITAADWQDTYKPLRYDYYINDVLILADVYSSEVKTTFSGKGTVKVKCVVKNQLDSEFVFNDIDVTLTLPENYSPESHLDALVASVESGEDTWEDILPVLVQLSQEMTQGDQLLSQALIEKTLGYFQPAQVTPTTLYQVSLVLFNALNKDGLTVYPLTYSDMLDTFVLALKQSLLNSAVYQEKLGINSQIQQQVTPDTIDTIVDILHLKSPNEELSVGNREKQLLDLLGQSSLLFTVPGAEVTSNTYDKLTLHAQRVPTSKFSGLSVVQKIQFPITGIDYEVPSSGSIEQVADDYLDYIFIEYDDPESLGKSISLTIFNSKTNEPVQIENLTNPIKFYYELDGLYNSRDLTCVSRQNPQDTWIDDCVLAGSSKSTKKTQVECQCSHLTDFGVLVEIVEESNISSLWTNFSNPEWNTKNIFSWVLLEQTIFFIIFFVFYQAAKQIDLKFQRTEDFKNISKKFNDIQSRFSMIRLQENAKDVYLEYFKKNQSHVVSPKEMMKIIYSKEAIKNSLKQELTYINWIFYPERHYPSRIKYVLLMIKIQALFFIIFLQTISEVEGTWKGYLYSMFIVLIFHLLINMLLRLYLVTRANAVEPKQQKRPQQQVIKKGKFNPMHHHHTNEMVKYSGDPKEVRKNASVWYMRPFAMFSQTTDKQAKFQESQKSIQSHAHYAKTQDLENPHNSQVEVAFKPLSNMTAKQSQFLSKYYIDQLYVMEDPKEEDHSQMIEDHKENQRLRESDDSLKRKKAVKSYAMHEDHFVIDLDDSEISKEGFRTFTGSEYSKSQASYHHDLLSRKLTKRKSRKPKESEEVLLESDILVNLDNTVEEKRESVFDNVKVNNQMMQIDAKQLSDDHIQEVSSHQQSQHNESYHEEGLNEISIAQESQQNSLPILPSESSQVQFQPPVRKMEPMSQYSIKANTELGRQDLDHIDLGLQEEKTEKKEKKKSKTGQKVRRQLKGCGHFLRTKEGKAVVFFFLYFTVTFMFLLFFAKTASSETQFRWVIFACLNVLFDFLLEVFIILVFVRLLIYLNIFYQENYFWKTLMQICGATHFLLQLIVDKYD